MMRYKYILIYLFIGMGVVKAQYQNFDLNNPDIETKTYIGRDYVRLTDGYSFKAATGVTMSAKINSGLTNEEAKTFLNIPATSSTNPDDLTVINTQYTVGQIPISSSVSASGAKCYNVPIEIVPGRMGFQPNISLSYNSQAGNGVVGMGWSISGLSSIERVNKNVFFDGKNDIPALNSNDAFTLDGNRLIEKNRVNYTTSRGVYYQINYETVIGNIKVTAFCRVPDLKYFKVYYPNGVVGVFGYGTNTTSKLSYPITSLEDINGSTITFSYTSDNTDINGGTNNDLYYIDEINYGKCSDKHDFAKIKFTYEDRPDQIFSLQSTKSIIFRKRLSTIQCYANPDLIRTYSLSYSNIDSRITSNSNDVSRLKQINSFVNTGSAVAENLNPLKFYYGEGGILTTSNQSTSLLSSNFDLTKINIVRGKFDPNIQNDALLVYPKGDIYKFSNLQYNNYYTAEYPVTNDLKVYQNLNLGSATLQHISAEQGFLGIFAADINGVGSDKIIKINSIAVANGIENIKFKIYNTNVTTPEREEIVNFGGVIINGVSHILPKEFYTGNFSGSGVTEVICIPKWSNNISPIRIINLNGGVSVVYSEVSFNKSEEDIIYPMDIDGDGQTELVQVRSNQTYLYKYKDGQILNIGTWSLKLLDFENKQILFSDLNADGKTDIIMSPKFPTVKEYTNVYVGSCYKCKSCGALISISNPPKSGICTKSCSECGACAADPFWSVYVPWSQNNPVDPHRVCVFCEKDIPWNGICPVHGQIVSKYIWTNPSTFDKKWKYLYSDGVNNPLMLEKELFNREYNHQYSIQDLDGDNTPELIVNTSGNLKFYPYNNQSHAFESTVFFATGSISNNSIIIPLDINSENKHIELISLNSNGIQKISFSQNRAKNNQISLMINSLGIADKTDYGQLYEGATYTPGTGANFPNTDFQEPFWVTTQSSSIYNKQIIGNTSYNYNGAILNKQGLGFRGFSAMSATDLLTNKEVTTEFDPYKMGAITKQTSDTEESTFTYNFTNYSNLAGGNKKMKLLPNTKTITDKIKGNTATTTYSLYDSYDNVGKEVTSLGGGISSTVENTYQNIATSNLNLIGMPTSKKITNLRDSKTFIQSEDYVYYPDNRLRYLRKYIEANLVSETEYEYNTTYGTLSKETLRNKITNNDADNLITSYLYKDEDKCSLWKKTDPLGLTTEYSYNFTTRLLTGVKDYLGNTVTYGYDTWRRKNYELRPDGTSTTLAWDWNTNDLNRLMFETQTSTGQPQTVTYADAFGRETHKEVQGFENNTWVCSDKEYDTFGHLKRNSAPYKMGDTPLWTTYSYDEYNRPTKVIQSNGSNTTYSYTGNQVSENKDGVLTSKITDATGQTISTTDAGGMVSYTYRADGQTESINVAGVVTSFEYDDYGRQIKLIDPSAGTVQTDYVDATHTATQTWNSGKQISTVSNKFGQTLSKTTPDFITTYSYDPTFGRPTGSISTNGTSKYLTYEPTTGRLSTLTETVNSKTYQEVYGYDDKGRIGSITYNTNPGANPISYPVTYKYNTNGYLSQLLNGTDNLYTVNSVNSLGQETNVLLGNNLSTSKSYTPEGLLTNVTTSNNIQNMSFDFNRINGTLNSRTDNRRGLTESFTYDSQYQLKSYGSGIYHQTMDYNPNGNINTKTDAASNYGYNISGRPYQLSGVSGIPNIATGLSTPIDISYTVNSRPTSINYNGYSATFTYNDAYDRAAEQIKQGTTLLTAKTFFAGGKYEIETTGGVDVQRLYLDGSPYTASIVLEKTGAAASQLYYLHRDYLGSVTQISDNNGNLAAEYSYDAWGRMRNVNTWQPYAQGSQPTLKFGRGYTGHEHLNQFGLINMNARLYDPVLGRFYAPDPFVSSGFSNDFNRYMYCRNNPLMYTDPSGKFINWLFWGGYVLYTAISYGKGVQSHNGEMDPTKWQSTTYTVGYSSNAGISAGFSFDYGQHSSNMGYNNGFNMSTTQNGVTQGGNPFQKHIDPISLVLQQEREARQAYYEYKNLGNFFSESFNDYVDLITPEVISLGISINAAAGVGGGVNLIDFTLITCGDDAGLYYSPTLNASISPLTEYSASAVINLSLGYYTGNNNNFRSDYLVGNYYGGSGSIGALIYGGVNGGYAPAPDDNGVRFGGVSLGIGFGAGVSANYQYTTGMTPIFRFRNLFK
ncbi:MAG: hypothetical protein GZ091_17640 [Paludibacter sp.]|nr:hypothetical protein [Paludibacter sp.]